VKESAIVGKKVLGILGGMGPDATCYFFQRVVRLTDAKSDSDHIEIVIHNNTKVPDRTRAILAGGESPVGELIRSAKLLERAGADMIAIPCITAHNFVDQVARETRTPILHAIRETVSYLRRSHPHVRRVGVLSTTGTFRSGIFQNVLSDSGFEPKALPLDMQEKYVMEAIYASNGIKAGYLEGESRNMLLHAANQLIAQGVDALIAGCTEIPLAIRQADFTLPFIDPMEVLALRSIEECLSR
jgi:aspartate racemase